MICRVCPCEEAWALSHLCACRCHGEHIGDSDSSMGPWLAGVARSCQHAALAYVEHGFAVLPLRNGQVVDPAVQPTRDVQRVSALWREWPTASVGAVVGADHVVLSCNGVVRASLEAMHGKMTTITAVSRAGDHLLWFRLPAGAKVAQGIPGARLVTGADWVVAPPSRAQQTSTSWQWASIVGCATAPAWMLEAAGD